MKPEMSFLRALRPGLLCLCSLFPAQLSAQSPNAAGHLEKAHQYLQSRQPDLARAEFAAAVWRNFLGARGARGIDDPGHVRHAVNLSGEYHAPKVSKSAPEESLRKLEETDDFSGVHDFMGEDVNLYVKYPELIYTFVRYIRRELVRLEGVSDEQILNGQGVGKFGKITDP